MPSKPHVVFKSVRGTHLMSARLVYPDRRCRTAVFVAPAHSKNCYKILWADICLRVAANRKKEAK